MSAFKDNLEEQRHRLKYQKEHFWAVFALSFIFGLFFLSFFGFSEQHWITNLFYVPNLGKTKWFYIIGALFLFGFRWWWNGIPKYAMFIINPILNFVGKLEKTKVFSPIISFLKIFFPSSETFEKLKRGKKEILDEFFYPKVTITDELKRVSRLFYFYTKKNDISNMFNFTSIGNSNGYEYDEDGTKRIISMFRDKDRENLIKRTKQSDKEKAERAKEILARRDEKYLENGLVSDSQEHIYRDLFLVIEGVIKSYDGENDKVHKAKIPSPLKIEYGKRGEKKIFVDESCDVFRDGKVYFSLDMIMDTVKNMTSLYIDFLKRQYSRQSRLIDGISNDLKSTDGIRMFEDFFKLVFFRRLLLNYGAIPTGWLCVRIENYDMRAIISAVDRPLIPTITSINDGSNKSFNSDVIASAFLFTYWAFFKEEKVEKLMEDIDWCFNTTKDYNEIRARELSANAESEELI